MSAEQPVLLIQVAPPGEGGVSDYLQCLKSEWAAQGVQSNVITLSQDLADERSLVDRIEDCSGETPCALVLHFSGYGFGRRGLCFWLLDELERLRARRCSGLQLIVLFHELFATGEPPWRSAFWLSHLQALIATRLARMADALWTNTEQHARWLRGVVGPQVTVHLRPVFSNIGDLAIAPNVAQRQAHAVVFGAASTRQRAIDRLQAFEPALRQLGIEQLIEVGPGGQSRHAALALPCHHAGRLALEDVSRLLQSVRFGLIDYPPQFLGKSSVFAAYASHGSVVLNTSATGPGTDGLLAGRHYLALPSLQDAPIDAGAQDAMAAHLMRWYAGHRLDRQAREMLTFAGLHRRPQPIVNS